MLGNAPHASFGASDVCMPITPIPRPRSGLPYVATLLGVKQVYPGRYVPDVLLRLIAREKVTFSHCADDLQDDAGQSARAGDLAGWKMVIGGSALPVPLLRAAVERGIDLIVAGMSETCPILTLSHLLPKMQGWEMQQTLPTAARPAGRFRSCSCASSTRTCALPHDGAMQGEVVVRSPWLTQGLGEPERSEDLWHGGWLHTGDVGVIDSDGYLKIVDRIKDVVKTGGEWVSSLDIEDLILRVPGVAEVAVVGVPDDKWGERPVALVVVKADRDGGLAEQAIQDHCAAFAGQGTISRYAVPDRCISSTRSRRPA
jgi:fatty-acyl-CoA synthase